jgi:hypothetical protein
MISFPATLASISAPVSASSGLEIGLGRTHAGIEINHLIYRTLNGMALEASVASEHLLPLATRSDSDFGR